VERIGEREGLKKGGWGLVGAEGIAIGGNSKGDRVE
jgi:hypothetical protein